MFLASFQKSVGNIDLKIDKLNRNLSAKAGFGGYYRAGTGKAKGLGFPEASIAWMAKR
jgi:hypothetical protein